MSISSTTTIVPPFSSSFFTKGKPPKCVYESIVGARETNEDKLNSFPVQNKLGFFCVHDGHSGIEAVDHMQKSMISKWKSTIQPNISSSPPNVMSKDTNVALLANLYHDAIRDLQTHESGVVSITAMTVGGSAIYFAWVGDCEGCVFLNDDPTLKNPCLESSACCSVEEIDFAEQKQPAPYSRRYCSSSPHSLSGNVRFKIPHTGRIHSSSVSHQPFFTCPENVEQFSRVFPVYFQHLSAHKEYMLAKFYNDRSDPFVATPLDVATHNIGETKLTLDVRFSGAIQPTRSLGDFNPVNYSIIRHPAVMRVLVPPQISSSCSILLCSDGMFSGHAFGGIQKVCRFVTNPVAFIQESFYSRGQILTERLIAAGLLPENLHHDQDIQLPFLSCHHKWKFSCGNWPQILTFIRNEHWQSITSQQILSVLEVAHGSLEQYQSWLDACDLSIKFLETMPNFNASIENTKAGAAIVAAHLAVIMGSSDNVTLVIAKAFE